MRRVLLLTALGLTTLAGACMWDMDTAAEESKGKISEIEVILGRFDLNSALYYRMRLERVAKELAKDASRFDLYDDAAVASDRLGDHDGAIVWMARKKKAMGPGSSGKQTDWYRYYANLGTFEAHGWLAKGGSVETIQQLDSAIRHIEEAIEMNADAHFGREIYQLETLKWIRAVKTGQTVQPLGEWVVRRIQDQRPGSQKMSTQKAVTGFLGLVKLGNAWESVDVFYALRDFLSRRRDGQLAHFASLRAKELEGEGKVTLLGHFADGYANQYPGFRPEVQQASFNEQEFKRLRRDADAGQAHRQSFMAMKLTDGMHPDSDETFWDGYEEYAYSDIRSPNIFTLGRTQMALMVGTVLALLVGGITTLVFIVRWAVRRRRMRVTR